MNIAVVAWADELQQLLVQCLQARGHTVWVCADLLRAVKKEPQLIFTEWAAGDRLAVMLAGLQEAASRVPPVPVIVLTPPGAAAARSRALAAGAADVLLAPPDPAELYAEIDDLQAQADGDGWLDTELFKRLRRDTLVGEDPVFLRCLEDIRRAARSDANILILGETGSGKEMVAQAIHKMSRRTGQLYLPVNSASFPGALLEAELFGYAKGAFTGADRERVGRFEEVGGGTLLLDEIGDIELPLQTKLLRAIEQRVFQRLGENRDRKLNARLISATSVDLNKAVAAGRFRPDLLGRIDQYRIVLPPLRERRADIAILAGYFLKKHAPGRLVQFSPTALDVLEAYDFPMNIRQLENAVQGALMRMDNGSLILPRHLPQELLQAGSAADPADRTLLLPASLRYKEAREYVQQLVDRIFLTDLLRKHHNNQSRVAEDAGIDRKTLRDRLKDLGAPEAADND